MALIHDDEELFGVPVKLVGRSREEVEQTVGTLSVTASVEVHRVVLNCLTVTRFPQHFKVEGSPGFQSMGLQFLAFSLKCMGSLLKFELDIFQRL